MTTTDIVRYTDTVTGADVELSVKLIQDTMCKNATDREALMFLELCRHQGLNPWVRDAYLIKYGKDSEATMVTGKDAFMKRADKHPHFDGIESGVIVQKGDHIENRIGTLVLDGEKLVGGWARVARNDRKIDITPTVSMDEFNSGRGLWQKMPGVMIEKCAIVTALRRAFPSTFAGMYDAAEMRDVEVDMSGEVMLAPEPASDVPPPPKVVAKAPAKRTATKKETPVVEAVASEVVEPDPPSDGTVAGNQEEVDNIVAATQELIAKAKEADGNTSEDSIPETSEVDAPEDFSPVATYEEPTPCVLEGHGDGIYVIMASKSTGKRGWVHDYTYELNGEERTGRCVYSGSIPVPEIANAPN
mgnify:FL=1